MRVHIEGMGVNGCLLAHLLHQYGVEFTWHDTYEERVAWQASTGAIYPSGSTKFGPDMECLYIWVNWHSEQVFGDTTEQSPYVFSTKAPPHQGRYEFGPCGDGLNVALPQSIHLNAQRLVVWTRAAFADKEISAESAWHQACDFYIRAHGWGDRLGHVYWGWTRLVTLKYDESWFGALRPCFYFREGRYIMAYAYPVPGTPYWYAGSSIIKQRADRRRSLEMEHKYARWRENFERLGNGFVTVDEEADFIEGWRPAASPEDEAWIRRSGNVLTVRPLWNSGIRHFPKQWAGIAQQLGIEDNSLAI